jgi:hypothetical protein
MCYAGDKKYGYITINKISAGVYTKVWAYKNDNGNAGEFNRSGW